MKRPGCRISSKEAAIDPSSLILFSILSALTVGVALHMWPSPRGVWVAAVEGRRLVLRVDPERVTLRCGLELLAQSPIGPSHPEGMLAASLPGTERRLVVRYALDGGVATAALWADGELVAGTLLAERGHPEEAEVLRALSARLRADAELRRL